MKKPERIFGGIESAGSALDIPGNRNYRNRFFARWAIRLVRFLDGER